ncbi:MAG: hypothetical protein IJD92_04130 [Bacilli bacterium]|nr:hypothetical protein [Bacilli bacterium]
MKTEITEEDVFVAEKNVKRLKRQLFEFKCDEQLKNIDRSIEIKRTRSEIIRNLSIISKFKLQKEKRGKIK